jgi:hypothetical protein
MAVSAAERAYPRPCSTEPAVSLPRSVSQFLTWRKRISAHGSRFLCLLLLRDEIAQQKADCYRAQKDYEQIIFQVLFPTVHRARYVIFTRSARMIFRARTCDFARSALGVQNTRYFPVASARSSRSACAQSPASSPATPELFRRSEIK